MLSRKSSLKLIEMDNNNDLNNFKILGYNATDMITLSFMGGLSMGWFSSGCPLQVVPAIIMGAVPLSYFIIKGFSNVYRKIQSIPEPKPDEYVLLEDKKEACIINFNRPTKSQIKMLTAYSHHRSEYENRVRLERGNGSFKRTDTDSKRDKKFQAK